MVVIKRFVVSFILFFVYIIQISVLCVYADDSSYVISKQHINITIDEKGQAYIEEYLTYDFVGVFDGVVFDIDYTGFGSIKDMQIFIEEKGRLISIHESASQKPLTFKLIDFEGISSYKIYELLVDCSKTFVYKYILTDAITVFNDTAQFNRKMSDRTVKNVTGIINLPLGADKNDIKIFIHGPAIFESKIESPSKVSFNLPEFNSFVEINLLFPQELVPLSGNIVNENVLDKIMYMETAKGDYDTRGYSNDRLGQPENEHLLRVNYFKRIGLITTVCLALLWIFVMIVIFYKFDKEFKVQFSAKYFRDLPRDYPPAIMSVLLNFNELYPRDLIATVIDLVRRKQLSIDMVNYTKKGMLECNDKVDYQISVTEYFGKLKLDNYELFLIDWLIKTIGDGETVTLESIKEYSKDSKNGIKFKEDYDKWCALARLEAAKFDFFDQNAIKGQWIGILFNIVIIITAVIFIFILKSTISLILIGLGFAGFLYSTNIHRRSEDGQEQLEKWMAFKRFLKDFTQIDKALIGSIVTWEYFFVYAISLGLAKEVISKLPLAFREDEFIDGNLVLFNMYYLNTSGSCFNSFDHMFNNTINVIEHAILDSQKAALCGIDNSTLT